MAGAPPLGRRTRTTRTTPSKYVRTRLLCGAHSSSRILVPPVGRWARTTQTTPSEYVRTTLLLGAHSSSRPLVASFHRQLVIDHSAVELPEPHPSDLFAPRSASMLHSTSPRVASTSPKIGHRLVLFLRFGALRHICATRHGHTGINPSNGLRRGLRLLRKPIDQHTPLLSEPDRPSRDPLGLRAPCLGAHVGAPSYLGRNRRCSWNVRAFSFGEFSSTRVIVWVSVHTSIRLARRTNCCSLSAENSTATNLMHLGPLSDLSRSTALHYCASRSFNHHFCRRTNYSAA